MSAPLAIAVLGARGKMGRFAADAIEEADGFRVAARLGSEDALEQAAALGATIGLDLTRAGLGFEHGERLLQAGLRIVIGTSGVDQEQTAELDRLARGLGLGGVVVPNFSIGAWLQQRLACDAARYLGSVSIVETHHPSKRDAPSGTARQTAEGLARALGVPVDQVPIQSSRVEGVHAEQRVLLGARAELLTIQHQVQGREAYRAGLLSSLRFAASTDGVARGLDAVLAAEGGRKAN